MSSDDKPSEKPKIVLVGKRLISNITFSREELEEAQANAPTFADFMALERAYLEKRNG